jgi:hypothetical protein
MTDNADKMRKGGARVKPKSSHWSTKRRPSHWFCYRYIAEVFASFGI